MQHFTIALKQLAAPLALLALSACDSSSNLPSATPDAPRPSAPLPASEAKQLAQEAYIYGYARLKNYEKTSNRAFEPDSPTYTGTNAFTHFPLLMNPLFARYANVPTPNNDTLYSSATLDLRSEPVVLTAGPVADASRYFSLQLLDLDTNVLPYISSITTSNQGGVYLVRGPSSDKTRPTTGFTGVIDSPSDIVTVLGRVQVFDELDQLNAIQVQRALTLQTLSAYRGSTAPAAAPVLPPYAESWDADESFLDFLHLTLPLSATHDAALEGRLARLGVGSAGFASQQLDAATREQIRAGITAARQQIESASLSNNKAINGWVEVDPSVLSESGSFGTDYLKRASVAYSLLYMNTRQEAYYGLTTVDGLGAPLDGAKSYRLRFAADQTPPSRYFWSVTVYDAETKLFFADIPPRYKINSTSPGVQYDAGGSLTLAIQATPPKDLALLANWLPVSQRPFYAVIRSYGPDGAILDGRWQPPGIEVAP